MLLGNKKKQGEEQNWSIVLSHLPNEIDKKRISRRISEIFSLSKEEASDLVSNTPIILLDNLTQLDAAKIREFFRTEGADVVMTNDIFFKRKCYRTVWPEPPNLGFLQAPKAPRIPAKDQAMKADEALKELRSMRPPSVNSPAPPPEISSVQSDDKEKGKIVRELEAWRKESFGRKDEMDKLKQVLDNTRDTLSSLEKEKKNQDFSVNDRERQLADTKAQLGSAAEKYEALRDEYKKSRMLYEERLSAARAEKDGVQAHLKQTEDKLRSLEDLNRGLRTSVERQNGRQDLSKSPEDYAVLQGKVHSLENEMKILKTAHDAENGRHQERHQALFKELEAEKSRALTRQDAATGKNETEKNLQEAVAQIEALKKARLDHEKDSYERDASLRARLDETRASLQRQIVELETEKGSLTAELQKHIAEAQSFKNKASAVDSQRAEIAALMAVKERLEVKLAEMANQLEAAHAKEQALHSELQEIRKGEQQLQERIDQIESEKSAMLKDENEKREAVELKFQTTFNEATHLRSGLQELSAEISRLEHAKKEAQTSLEAYRASEQDMKSKFESLGQKYNTLIGQYDKDKLALLKSQDSLRELESSTGFLRKEVDELRTMKSHLESRLGSAETKLQELEKRNAFNETLKVQLTGELEQIKGVLKKKAEEAAAFAEQLEQMKLRLEQAQDEARTYAARLKDAEERMHSENRRRDIESKQKEAALSEINQKHEEKTLRLKELQENTVRDREAAAKIGHLLEQRERDLEGLRKQLRDMNQQMEQREALLKRNQIVAELTDKENQLKRMIEDQSRIENEIKEREEMIRLTLRRQEEIEKEIISGKQAQRHLLEQVKKERPGASRFSKYEKKETDEE